MNVEDTQSVTLESITGEASRRAFLGKVLAGAAAATALSAAPISAFASSGKMVHTGASIPKSDAAILNFALTLEHLEAKFYGKAVHSMGAHGGYVHKLMTILKGDEDTHVAALTSAIHGAGYTPVKAYPKYHFGNVFGSRHTLLAFSAELESTGVHAYLGQAGNIKTPAILLTAASIVTVEARHTGAVKALMAQNPTEGAFDKGYTKEQVVKIITPIIKQ